MKRSFFLFLITFKLFAFVSDDLKYLEVNNEERQKWVNSKNALLNYRYKIIKNTKQIEDELKKIDNQPLVIFRDVLNNNQNLEVIQNGYGKEFIITLNGNKVFNSFDLNRNGHFLFNSLSLSPNNKYLILSAFEKGNTEDFQVVFINLETNELILQRKVYSGVDSCFFINNDNCILSSPDKRRGESVLVKYDLANMLASDVKEFEDFSDYGNFAVVKINDEYFIIDNENNYFKYDNASISESEVFGKNNNEFYHAYQELNQDDVHQLVIEKVVLSKSELPKTYVVFKTENEVKGQVLLFKNAIGLITSFGLDRKVRVLNLEGKVLLEKELPYNYRYFISNIDLDKKEITFIISAGNKRETKTFSFNSENFYPNSNLWEFNGLQLEVKNYFATSLDGTKVPFQTIGVKTNSNLPRHAFQETYGGFNINAYLFRYKGIEQYYPFFKRGGLLVNTGVRGGGEFGINWHTSAMKENKIKTFEDNAAIAKYLIDNGISKKEWITLTGSSNGGYVSATSGLLFSDYFSLIIPHAGVLDQLAKKRLDPEYNGWVREYLDETKSLEKDMIESISPVELAKNKVKINYLIFAEQNDTRVNPVHSYKFYTELSKNNLGETYLYSMKNFGHYAQGYSTGYLASWRYWSIVWNYIFDTQK